MHPSIALQVAERELQEEGQAIPGDLPAPPPLFLHFAPRWHQKRRTMTGVLAGYFDQPKHNPPLPILPGVQDLLARTAEPAMTEDELNRLESERRRAEAISGKRGRPNMARSKRRDADIGSGVVVADSKRPRNQSSTRSDSPLTELKILSEESSPPLTPTSSKSDYSLQEDLRLAGEKKGKPSYPFTVRVSVTAAAKPTAAKAAKSGIIASSENKAGKKRKASEMEQPMQRQRQHTTAVAQGQKTKVRPGWKGWVEVEGSPEPKDKLINLDFPVPTLEKRTRSGKVAPAIAPLPNRSRKASTAKSSTRATTEVSETPAPGSAVESSLGSINEKDSSEEPKVEAI